MRRPEDCPYRADVREEGGREWARCGLVGEITGAAEPGLGRVARAGCAACCATAEAPAPGALNAVVASLLYTAARDVIGRGGVAGCDRDRALGLRERALLDLPRVGPGAPSPLKNVGPCFHLGGQVGERDCPTCRGSVRLKVYACQHPRHDRVTLADCRGCHDFDPQLGRGLVASWAVGVTTAPREPATLGRCLASLAAAGWDEPRVFAEPGAEVPPEFAHLPVTRRDRALGEWPNWLLGLAELVLRHPSAAAYLMVEDDTVFSRGVRAFLEADLWPERRVGLVSVYCPEPYARPEGGWHRIRSDTGLIGSLAFVFPNAAARLLLADPDVVNHRRRGVRDGLVDTDGAVGRWAARAGLPVFYHSPSLAQHVGDTSTVWPGAPNSGRRRSANFAGEDFEAAGLAAVAAPLVSCIMPTRDRRGFVRLALRHFLAQDYPNKELIVVDDGDDPVADLAEGLPGVRFLRLPERATIGEKRNLACLEARGAVIAHWDDDDWYAPHRLSYQVGPIVAGECDLTGLENTYVLALPGDFWTTGPALHRRMFVGDVHGGTLVYRKAMIGEGVSYPATDLAEDAALITQALDRGKRLTRLPNPGVYVYVRHGTNAWQFEAGRFLDPEGWHRIDPPPTFQADLLPEMQAAATDAPTRYPRKAGTSRDLSYMKILQESVGYGDLGLDGDLGFSALMTGDKVMLPPRITYDHPVSAHAPSELIAELPRPTSVRGVLNASASLRDGGACEFWIDDHWIGDLSVPCKATPAIRLAPGTYRFRIRTTSTNYGAHSLWLFDDDPSGHARVALVTIACYPEGRVKDEVRWLFSSAARVGWLVHAFGVGTRFENCYKSKVERLAAWLKSLPSCYEFVAYLDARDAFVFGTEAEALSKLTWPVVVGMESGPWPEQGEPWASAFRALASEREPQTWLAFINAGMFAGRRDSVVACLEGMIELQRDWLAGGGPEWLKPYRHFYDDQFLWQAYYRSNPAAIKLDTKAEFLCNMSWQHVELAHKEIHPGERTVRTRYGTEPLFLHFSGPETPNLHHWFYWLLGD